MVTRRKIRRRNARKLKAFWDRFENGRQEEVSPLIKDLRDEVLKRAINQDGYEVRYTWGEPIIYEPPKGRIFGLITD